ncbi:MAG TPA: adenylate/guanylate cyclase domain-containing protein [Actinomycetota bacterium]|nr:adenylate/guanylate cyclase domain-containing protein [Actinomycetota bacterium]
MARYETPEEEWAALLSGTHPHLQHASPLRFVPSSPRCKLCKGPFGAPGSLLFARMGIRPWEKNPNICGRCFRGLKTASNACPVTGEGREFGGAEVELSMLFADVRGSSKIARQMPVMEFTRLMNRFYRVSSEILFGADAIVEKFVGDEVVGLFVPFLAGQEHARKALEAAQALFHATGHGSEDGPWVPLGAGVHTGTAFVGIVSSAEGTSDFTALGDPVNVAAHLSAQAAVGEVLLTDQAAAAASLPLDGLERRHLSLKGHPVDAVVLDGSRVGT